METSKTSYTLLEKTAGHLKLMSQNEEMTVVYRTYREPTLSEKMEVRRLELKEANTSCLKELSPILPQEAMDALSMLKGQWKLSGEDLLNHPASDHKIVGFESYEWVPGGFFLSGKWNMFFGSDDYQGISVMGYNAVKEQFYATNFDNAGYVRHYKLKICGLNWTLTGNRERIAVNFAPDGQSFVEIREMSPDNKTWQLHCRIYAEKLPS